jgi:hypothetical protein
MDPASIMGPTSHPTRRAACVASVAFAPREARVGWPVVDDTGTPV